MDRKPRGRPPSGAKFEDGEWRMADEVVIEKQVARLIKHRQQCRERYRANRDALRAIKPELFKNGRGKSLGSIQGVELPIGQGVLQGITEEGRTCSPAGC